MNIRDGGTQAWLILTVCAALTISIVILAGYALSGRVQGWLDELAKAPVQIDGGVGLPPGEYPEPYQADAKGQIDRAVAALPPSADPVPVAPERWITSDDYPMDALRAEAEGTTQVQLDINQGGWPVTCQIVSSSGHASLDQATCRAFIRSARFNRGMPGAPADTRRQYIRRVVWRMPA